MKKGLLLVLAVLLVAGLFVSCNSDVSANAGASSKDHAYVTFDKASAPKSVSPTVNPADAPSIDDLYWYYKAIKASGTVHEGEKKEWTRVNSSTGLSGTIGPFSVGEWYFALVGITSETEPSLCPNVTYELDGDTVTWGGYANTSVRYIGISGTSGYTTKENVTLAANQSDPTYIPMSLQQVNMTSKVTVKLDGLQLVGSSGITSGSNVWLDVLKGDSPLGSRIEVTAGASGAVVPASTSREFELSSAVEQVTLNFKLYDKNDDNAPVVKEASVSFLATKGATVTLAGSLDAIEVYGSFNPANSYEAYVVSNSTGAVTFKDTLANAITTAQAGDTVGIVKDIDYGTASYTAANAPVKIEKSIVLEGNGHSISGNNEAESAARFVLVKGTGVNVKINNITVSVTGPDYASSGAAVQFRDGACGVINNSSITGPSCGVVAVGVKDAGNKILTGNIVTINNSNIMASGNSKSENAIYNAAVDAEYNAKVIVNNSELTGLYSLAIYTSGGTIEINGTSSLNGPILLYGNSGYSDYSRKLVGSEEITRGGAYGNIFLNGGTYNLNAQTDAGTYKIIGYTDFSTYGYPAAGGFVFRNNDPSASEIRIAGGSFESESSVALSLVAATHNNAKVSILTSLGIVLDSSATISTDGDYTVYTKTL